MILSSQGNHTSQIQNSRVMEEPGFFFHLNSSVFSRFVSLTNQSLGTEREFRVSLICWSEASAQTCGVPARVRSISKAKGEHHQIIQNSKLLILLSKPDVVLLMILVRNSQINEKTMQR